MTNSFPCQVVHWPVTALPPRVVTALEWKDDGQSCLTSSGLLLSSDLFDIRVLETCKRLQAATVSLRQERQSLQESYGLKAAS